MVRINWERDLPLGVDWEAARLYLGRAWLYVLLWSLKAPLAALLARGEIYTYIDGGRKVVYNGMKSIDWVMRGSLYGILLLAVTMPFLAIYFYSMHFRGSKSIYTMRRLPKRGELLRRCIKVPLMTMLQCMVSVPVLRSVYYLFYELVTPKGHMPVGQWRLLWEGFLC